MSNVKCLQCNGARTLSDDTLAEEGFDGICDVCTMRNHLDFMATTGRRQGLSCDKDCPCQERKKR
jgi:hypothetical protein